MDKVFIEGLEIEALIGVYDWERRIRQPLRFDLEMSFDNRKPAATDAIADTLDYKAVSKRLIAFVGISSFELVETLAERCALLVLREFQVEHLRLKLSVRGAVAVGVEIERSRADLPPDEQLAAKAAPPGTPASSPATAAARARVALPAAAMPTRRGANRLRRATSRCYLSLGSNIAPEEN